MTPAPLLPRHHSSSIGSPMTRKPTASQSQINCNSTTINYKSTAIQPQFNRNSTTNQLQINRNSNSTAIQSQLNRKSTTNQPQFSRNSIANQPQINRKSTANQQHQPKVNRKSSANQPQTSANGNTFTQTQIKKTKRQNPTGTHNLQRNRPKRLNPNRSPSTHISTVK